MDSDARKNFRFEPVGLERVETTEEMTNLESLLSRNRVAENGCVETFGKIAKGLVGKVSVNNYCRGMIDDIHALFHALGGQVLVNVHV